MRPGRSNLGATLIVDAITKELIMAEWKKTTCVLCANICGLEAFVEGNRITRVRGDKDNPRSRGYVCRKGLSIKHYQHHADRLTHPLKRVGERFEKISWEQAIEEVSTRLKAVVDEHGPRSLALMMGGGSLGCPAPGAFAVNLLRGLGSQYFSVPWPRN
jgi:anaerobic selenocysteine-containing dehydrogenase